jgi:hypothetical protein
MPKKSKAAGGWSRTARQRQRKKAKTLEMPADDDEEVTRRIAEERWSLTFEDPIPLPDGRELRTLRDAAEYIASLPERENDTPEWRTALTVLMINIEHGGDTTLLRMSIMRALDRGKPSPEPTRRKRRVKKHIIR